MESNIAIQWKNLQQRKLVLWTPGMQKSAYGGISYNQLSIANFSLSFKRAKHHETQDCYVKIEYMHADFLTHHLKHKPEKIQIFVNEVLYTVRYKNRLHMMFDPNPEQDYKNITWNDVAQICSKYNSSVLTYFSEDEILYIQDNTYFIHDDGENVQKHIKDKLFTFQRKANPSSVFIFTAKRTLPVCEMKLCISSLEF